MNISNNTRFVYCALRGIPILGLSGSLKFLAAALGSRTVQICPKGYKQPLSIRGRTSDVETFYSIVIRQSYPIISKPVKTIVDAGANVGYSAAFFSSVYPEATIYALEPELKNYEMLVENTNLTKNIVPLNIALWKTSEDLYLQNETADPWAFQFGENPNKAQKTRAVSLVDLMTEQEIKNIDILKIDIEGAEKQVFSGDVGWLDNVSTSYIETHDRFVEGAAAQIFKAMSDYEYSFDVRYEYIVFENIRKTRSQGPVANFPVT